MLVLPNVPVKPMSESGELVVLEVARGEKRERVAARWHADDRHAGRNGAGAFGDDGRGATRDGIADVGVAIERCAGHGDEQHARSDPAAVFAETR